MTIPAPFALSVHEVTFDDYDRFTYPSKVDDEGWGRGKRPVINVSWNDAQDYVEWLWAQTGAAYRLPSEAEWEYAARARTATKYHWGNEIDVNQANCNNALCGDEWEFTAPAGSFAPNAFGVHDMHGNVWEWVEDCWNDSYARAPADGSAWVAGGCTDCVLRGGAWFNLAKSLRAADRARDVSGPRRRQRLPRGPDAHPLKRYLLTTGGFQGGRAPLVVFGVLGNCASMNRRTIRREQPHLTTAAWRCKLARTLAGTRGGAIPVSKVVPPNRDRRTASAVGGVWDSISAVSPPFTWHPPEQLFPAGGIQLGGPALESCQALCQSNPPSCGPPARLTSCRTSRVSVLACGQCRVPLQQGDELVWWPRPPVASDRRFSAGTADVLNPMPRCSDRRGAAPLAPLPSR